MEPVLKKHRGPQTPCFFSHQPNETIVRILSNLDFADLQSTEWVSHRWQELTRDTARLALSRVMQKLTPHHPAVTLENTSSVSHLKAVAERYTHTVIATFSDREEAISSALFDQLEAPRVRCGWSFARGIRIGLAFWVFQGSLLQDERFAPGRIAARRWLDRVNHLLAKPADPLVVPLDVPLLDLYRDYTLQNIRTAYLESGHPDKAASL